MQKANVTENGQRKTKSVSEYNFNTSNSDGQLVGFQHMIWL